MRKNVEPGEIALKLPTTPEKRLNAEGKNVDKKVGGGF
jgi:hypothetical protein